MKFHWKVLAWMLAGVLVGLGMQALFPAPAWSGLSVAGDGQRVVVQAVDGPAQLAGIAKGEAFRAVLRHRGATDERMALREAADLAAVVERSSNGDVLWLVPAAGDTGAGEPLPLTLGMEPASPRARSLAPFAFVAGIFMSLLKMLIVPLVISSIVSGVAGVGALGDLRRLGLKTFAYYLATSLLAIILGQFLVNVIRPGVGARLGLSAPARELTGGRSESFVAVLERMVPENVFEALTNNGAMLSIIFFALVFGYAITRTAEPHGRRVRELFESVFEVMMRMAEGVLGLLPYGVFALMVKVVGGTGFAVFAPLAVYMVTVTLALVLHAGVTLPLVLRLVGGISPRAWLRAMAPALMTAFSTSSSSMTLPMTLETVEQRGRVSNRITSFTLPLGATINMDGTALYECIAVIFLAQYYASSAGYELTFGGQALVVLMALLASVGAAGIPSAGLVMMLTILAALKLPLEGAALLLAVDRPLDMLRTVVNVWSDSCGAAVIARSEGEPGPSELAVGA